MRVRFGRECTVLLSACFWSRAVSHSSVWESLCNSNQTVIPIVFMHLNPIFLYSGASLVKSDEWGGLSCSRHAAYGHKAGSMWKNNKGVLPVWFGIAVIERNPMSHLDCTLLAFIDQHHSQTSRMLSVF